MKNNKLPFKKVSIKSRQTRPHVWKQHNLPPSRGIEEVLHSAAQSENVSWPKKTRTCLNELTQLQLLVFNFSFWNKVLAQRRYRLEQWRVGKRLHQESFTSHLPQWCCCYAASLQSWWGRKYQPGRLFACVCLSVCKTTTTKCIQNVALDCSSDARRKMPAETAEWI